MTIPFSALTSEAAIVVIEYWISCQQVLNPPSPSILSPPPIDGFGFFRPRRYMINKWVLEYACEHYGKTNTVMLNGEGGQQSFIKPIERSVFYQSNKGIVLTLYPVPTASVSNQEHFMLWRWPFNIFMGAPPEQGPGSRAIASFRVHTAALSKTQEARAHD